jgi:hypothetical protein
MKEHIQFDRADRGAQAARGPVDEFDVGKQPEQGFLQPDWIKGICEKIVDID